MERDSECAWSIVARDGEFRRALAALRDGEFQGVALVGDSGVGKSTLARMLAKSVESVGWTVRFALGTQTGSAVPLGAFSRVVSLGVAHEPALMLAAAHKTLEQDENLVVVVDDAQLLDPLSATLVSQLAASRSARLIVTIRSGEPVFDAVTALIKERLLLTVHVDPFTREQTAELAGAVLGGVVEARLVDELFERSGGNLVLLRGLLSAGRESGALVCVEGCWRLRGALQADRELYELLGFRLQSLTPEELEVVEVLATAELLEWEILRSICDAGAAARLEHRGLIQLLADGSQTLAQLNDPVIGEAALRHAGVVRSRQLNGQLAQALYKHLRERAGRTRPADLRARLPDLRARIRLAQFMMRSDLDPDLDVVIEAAAAALAMSDIALAEELARFAVDRGGGLAAAIVLAEAVSWQGRADEAAIVLADADPEGADESLTVQWACRRAANLFFDCGRVEQARAALADARNHAKSCETASLVSATEASIACFTGDVATAIELGLPLCAPGQPASTIVWAITPTTWALALVGRTDDVQQVANRGEAATHGRLGPYGFVSGLAEVMAQAAAGNYSAAEDVWKRYAATAAGVPQADAMAQAMLGLIHLSRGALPDACAVLQDATSVMSQGFPLGWLMLVAAWWAQGEGARGDGEAAAAALKCAEKAYGPQVAVFAPELELARAWERAAVGEMTAARTHAVQAARLAQQYGIDAVEIRARHTAVRFGDPSQAARLKNLASTLNTAKAEAVANHARALARHDGDLLDAAAREFADLGALVIAADAAAQAAAEHARRGERGKEIESSTWAYRLAGQCGLRTPAFEAAARPLPFSGRERQIAMLVVAGLSNRQIADRLFISVRTVEGHLYRIFAKLGITNRDQLAHLISRDAPDHTLRDDAVFIDESHDHHAAG